MVVATVIFLGIVEVTHQTLQVEVDPSRNRLEGSTTLTISQGGDLAYDLHPAASLQRVLVNGAEVQEVVRGKVRDVPAGASVRIDWSATHEEDVQAGERVGQIHNHSVKAHVGLEGVFLSEGSAWHPQPLDDEGRPQLRAMEIDLRAPEGWSLVASGNPRSAMDLASPTWSWHTPRPVDGMAVVGNRHIQHGRRVQTPQGPVAVVVHLSPEQAHQAHWYLDAAQDYLELYTPLLGAYPFERFTIVENFFSSGFAFPGFTVLGPRVIAMAPRSLKPGYLDHELVHAWRGNGVYVDPEDGNWCEALTSYCANYGRRAIEGGAAEARAYRRGILNRVSLDPSLDNGPLGDFGRGSTPSRFVGYDKGSFVFMMLEDVLDADTPDTPPTERRIWSVCRRLVERYLGQAIGWAEIQAAAEAEFPERPTGWLDAFFQFWVREHVRPVTEAEMKAAPLLKLSRESSPDGTRVRIDPDFRHYRLLPPTQQSPTIAGTLGDGMTVRVDPDLPLEQDLTSWMAEIEPGDSLLLIGHQAIIKEGDRLARADDPIEVSPERFTVAGQTWSDPGQSVLHTVRDPDQPDRYVTIFHSNGQDGWQRLRGRPPRPAQGHHLNRRHGGSRRKGRFGSSRRGPTLVSPSSRRWTQTLRVTGGRSSRPTGGGTMPLSVAGSHHAEPYGLQSRRMENTCFGHALP